MAGIAINQVRQCHISSQLALWMMLLLFGWGHAGYAQSVLEAIEVTNLSGGRTQLRFQLSGPIQTPRSFTINDPARIVLDFPDTRSGLAERQQPISGSVADRVNVLEAGNRTRASINLARLVPFTVNTERNAVVVLLGATGPGTTTAGTPSISRTPPRVTSNIDFRRGVNSEGIISVRLSDPSTPVSVRQEGNRIIADFQRAPFPRGQERRLDVTDFATPVTLIDIQNQENDGRLVIQPMGRYEYLAYQADDLYTIEVKPVQEVAEEQQEDPLDPRRQPRFTGDLLSLNFQDIEVRAVLQIIADFTGQNVVVSDTVQGNLTLRLQNVPWDQALDIILRTKGLTLRQTGNVMYIAPTEEVAARERLLLEARKTVNELEPLRTEIIQINFAKADELRNLIIGASQGAAAAGGAAASGGDGSLLSNRGKVNVDVRTNSLLVQDIAAKIAEIRALIARLDIPVRQVMIDSRVVIANDDFSKELGIRWGVTAVRQTGNDGIITTTGSLQGTSAIVDSAIANLTNSGQPFPVALPNLGQRLGVNLGVADPLGRLGLALLGKNYLVDLELSALQTEGRGEVLSNPRVLTTDRNKAFIKQGREIPYQTVTDDGAVQTEFKEALLELEVVPQIAPDGTIILDLKIKKDEQGELVPSALGSLIPTIQKREVQTQVRVDNGQTVVLGGVFEQITSDTLDKVPFLGDLPAIGRLFQRRGNRDNKLELLIFVTPQIINDGQIANANR